MATSEKPPDYFINKNVENGRCSPGFFSDHSALHIPHKVYKPLGKERIRKLAEQFFGGSSVNNWFTEFECDSHYIITLPQVDHTDNKIYDLIGRIELESAIIRKNSSH